ncbi:hypothetical protein PEBR_20106 [Penicillium brasilianum]|uniref:Uncharacterized protein n=1 Tax=Penicillium brasilianum TaxID=104259 RepID=A0A1S9RQ80_PENBI|nr:hypothetical protein PEBR_20106 [Penicillium brasilianum]
MMLFDGPLMEIMPLTDKRQVDGQQPCAVGDTLILEKRGPEPQPLDAIMCAPGYWVPVNPVTGPAFDLSGSLLMNENLKKDGQIYAITNDSVKDVADKDIVAGKNLATNDLGIKKDIGKTKICVPFVGTSFVGIPNVATVQDLIQSTSTDAQTLAGTNPEADVFIPQAEIDALHAYDPNPGLASNEAFMASYAVWIAKVARNGYRWPIETSSRSPVKKSRYLPARVLLFKGVPNWLNLSDVFGLVYGGAVEHIFRSEMAEITVIFCEEAACNAYLSVHANGIRAKKTGSDDEYVTMLVEKAPRGQEITSAMQNKIASGGSRVVRVDGVFDAEKTKALTDLAFNYELDHMQFYSEKEKAIPALFFFCGIVDAWAFKQKLDDNEEWANHTTEFVADPCKVATGFHDNAVPNRMAAAVVAAA